MAQRVRWVWVVIAASLPMLGLAILPATSRESCTSGLGEPLSCTTRHLTLVEAQGWGVALVLLVPIVLAALPLLLPWRPVGYVVAALFSLATFLALMSVGIFFVPVVCVAWWAASAEEPVAPRPTMVRPPAV